MERHWIRQLAPYVSKQRATVAITIVAALAGAIATAVQPMLMRSIVDDSILARTTPIAPLLALLLLLGVVRFGIGFVRRYYGGKIGAAVDYDLRNAIYSHLHRLDFARHDQMQTGQLVSRANLDVGIVQRLVSMIPMLSSNVLLFPVSLVFMVTISIPLTLIALVVLPWFLWLAMRSRAVVYPSSWDASQRNAEVTTVVDDAVAGVRIVKGFGQEQRELDRLVDSATTLFGSRMRNVRLSARRQATMLTVPLIAQVAILGVGGMLAIEGQLTIGSFLAFLTYLAQLIAPIGMIARLLVMGQTARASAERILEILTSTPEVVEQSDAVRLNDLKGAIDLDAVTFGYVESRPALNDVTLRIDPGETVAFVGASGSGKSTLAALLPRFYDVQHGAIRLDGVDVRDVTIESLRGRIATVFQDSFLFSASVRDNIAYGRPDATVDEVEAAARAAEAHEFVTELPKGYDTLVGERGLTLSGGQRQRLAIARALLTDPRVLILDDATASVDAQTEAQIHRTLRRVMRGRTTLLIAHRRSTLELAQRIVVMDSGSVLDIGSHDELMVRCHQYRMLLAGPGDDIEVPTEQDAAFAPPQRADEATSPLMLPIGAGAVGLGTATALSLAPGELQAAIDALPPIRDTPDVDVTEAARDHGGFRIWSFIAPYRWPLVLGLGLVCLNALAGLAGPFLIQRGIDHGVVDGNRTALLVSVGLFIGAALVSRSLSLHADVYTGRTGQRMLLALRTRIFAHLQRLGLDFYDREMGGRVMTRMTSDVEAMNSLLQTGLLDLLTQVVTFVGVVIVLSMMNPELAAILMLVVPPLVAATLLYRHYSGRAYLRVRELVGAVNADFQESVAGIRVAKAFVREDHSTGRFRQLSGEYLDARIDSQRVISIYFPFVELMQVVATALVLGAGSRLIANGSLTAGELIAFSLYITYVFAPIQQLSNLFDTYQQARVAMGKLRELLATSTSTPASPAPVDPGRLTGRIELKDVHFRYSTGSREVLHGVTLHIEPGETVAFVGETGAGKSTLVKMMARFYDVSSGRVLIDGKDVRDLDVSRFRQQLGYVPQEPFLFSGTIHDNIAYGRPDATQDEVEAAAAAVGADAFIGRLPDGYDHPVSERGHSLSGGERQLLALARAQLVDPAVLVLDEATSNLDLATEARVNRAMGVVSHGRTTVLIAHRLATAHRCDRVFVVDDGRVVESGPPEELVAAGGHYATLWQTYHAVKQPA